MAGKSQRKASKTTRGLLQATACPWCKHPQSFEEENAVGLLEQGNTFKCEKCNKLMVVTRLQPTVLIWLKQCK